MSYGPPPARTPYGDQDFIKEDWPPGGPPSSSGLPQAPAPPPPPLAPPPASPYASPYPALPGEPYSQGHLAATAPPGVYGQMQTAQAGQLDVKQIAAQTYNLTPEDQIFMQTARRDSFYQRVLPLAVLFNGAYFYHNHSRQLPHKVIPYSLLTVSAYILGKWSFKEELKRRLEANPSQTQFMTSLRAMLGTQSHASAMGEFTSDMSQDYMSSGFSAANAPLVPPLAPTAVNSAYTRRGPPMGGGGGFLNNPGMPDSQMYPDSMGNVASPDSDGVPLSTTSYEELRARNRGLIQK